MIPSTSPDSSVSRPSATAADGDVVIIGGVRTPFIKSSTLFQDLTAHDLGTRVVSELVQRMDVDPAMIDEVIIGNVSPPVEAPNIARVIALRSGLPESVPAYTVNRNCASGIQSIAEAFYRIASGTHSLVLAGGTESMSNIPLLFPREFGHRLADLRRARSLSDRLGALRKFRPGHVKPVIGLSLGLIDYNCGLNMGQTAEGLAREFDISRSEQDEFALISHRRAIRATREGFFDDEIVPVYLPGTFDAVTRDNGPREGQSLEALAGLRPIFAREGGSVTVGNACPVTDGSAALLLASRTRATELGLKPRARIRSFAFAGLDPSRMGLGPACAVPPALDRAGLVLGDIERIELNEAFGAQVIANERCFVSRRFARDVLDRPEPIGEIDREILNVNGGAVAIGHPVGATGTRLILTLLREMERSDRETGLATLCIGGGQGAAMVIERR